MKEPYSLEQRPGHWYVNGPGITFRTFFDGEHAVVFVKSLNAAYAAGQAASAVQLETARVVLKEHHDWHLQAGPIGLPDGNGGWIEIDSGGEYSDSAMFERTEAVLAGMPPDEAGPMPRGGITAYWWQVGVLERRKRKAVAVELETARAQVEGMRKALNNMTWRLEHALGLLGPRNSNHWEFRLQSEAEISEARAILRSGG